MARPSLPDRPQPDPFGPHYQELFGFVTSLVRCGGVRPADVADVTQEVFLLFDRALRGGLDTSRSLHGWFRRTCARKVRDHRKRAREREQPARARALELAGVADAPTPEDVVMKSSAFENVEALLDKLPHEQRLVFVMSDMQEMPAREIAEVLEIPEGTVASRLAAARKAMRRAWEERRASGLPAVAPFALWDLGSLLKHTVPPPVSPELKAEVWRGLVEKIPRLAKGEAAEDEPRVPAAPKVLTVKQAAVGFVLSALLGAVLGAVLFALLGDPSPKEDASALVSSPSYARSAATSPSPVAPSPPDAVVVPASTASASASASAAAPSIETHDRMLINEAHIAIAREDYARARAALLRVRGARFAGDRDTLLRDVVTHLDGGR